jgi:hypothetical protein
MSRLHGTPPLGLTALSGHGLAAAVEQVEAAHARVGLVAVEVQEVAARLRLTADIPWSGAAGDAWRARVERAVREVQGGVTVLDELAGRLAVLAERLRAS